MFEYFNPLISLFKLLIAGLEKITGNLKSSRNKAVYRRIIEIQLLLEDIIDSARDLLSRIKILDKKERVVQADVKELKHLLDLQLQRLYLLRGCFHDNTTSEILKLFTPNIRRRIINLIEIKVGALEYLLFYFLSLSDIKLVKNEIIVYPVFDLRGWNHERFIKEGHHYSARLAIKLKDTGGYSGSIFKRQKEQERVINELSECSNELSNFIGRQIRIEDVIPTGKKREMRKSSY